MFTGKIFLGPESAVRGRPGLYLPTDDCESLTTDQINQVSKIFKSVSYNIMEEFCCA